MRVPSRADFGRDRNRSAVVLALAVLVAVLGFPCPAAAGSITSRLPENPLRVRSAYSEIILRDQGKVRSLSFVRDSGEIVVETLLDLAEPARLLMPYTRHLFGSLLFVGKPESVLLLGLGGGAMVHFAENSLQGTHTYAVEIDPKIIQLAQAYFGIESGPNTTIIHADAYDYVAGTPRVFDIVFLDAFLKPAADTDVTGVPTRLKEKAFFDGLRRITTPHGVIAFNINLHETADADVQAIQSAFPQVYLFPVPGHGNLVVIASMNSNRMTADQIRRAAAALDARMRVGFSFAEIAATQVEKGE